MFIGVYVYQEQAHHKCCMSNFFCVTACLAVPEVATVYTRQHES